jgi:hypothetical protein
VGSGLVLNADFSGEGRISPNLFNRIFPALFVAPAKILPHLVFLKE